jgi:hypothetical protein
MTELKDRHFKVGDVLTYRDPKEIARIHECDITAVIKELEKIKQRLGGLNKLVIEEMDSSYIYFVGWLSGEHHAYFTKKKEIDYDKFNAHCKRLNKYQKKGE